MAGPETDTEFGRWEAEEGLPDVECSLRVMEEIRVAAVEAFHKVQRGGLEIGGVLYGTASVTGVRIVSWKPMECEHARGPAFLLSERDEALLAPLLRPDGELRAVGWFVSHGRGELSLTEGDAAICEKYFPKTWQVALVLKPAKFLPVRGRFFARRQGAPWSEAVGASEFCIEARPRRRSDSTQSHRVPPSTPEPAIEHLILEPPKFLTASPPSRRLPIRKRWLAAALVLAALAGGWQWAAPKLTLLAASAQQPPQLSLKVTEYSGQLRIEWDRGSRAIESAEGGSVDIVEAGAADSPTVLDLSADELRRGSVTYARRSEDVRVRLTVHSQGRTLFEMAQFVGPPLKPKTEELEALRRDNLELAEQVRRLTGQLKDERKRVRVLQDGISIIEKSR